MQSHGGYVVHCGIVTKGSLTSGDTVELSIDQVRLIFNCFHCQKTGIIRSYQVSKTGSTDNKSCSIFEKAKM